jgi:hypothetical protein
MREPGPDFDRTFHSLRSVLRAYEDRLVPVRDEATEYHLDTSHLMPNGKPLFFGLVRTGKRYVSYHLMPVYLWPDILEEASPELRRRMQGKSCFNFTREESELFEELAALTRIGYHRYEETGYLA